mmetsp:Transcript_14205/g.19432  ORF Transcript_14205/g.19432 Transcript_14205/m.19432 type:complete len:106 (-) Transcript_14205:216-533(-)
MHSSFATLPSNLTKHNQPLQVWTAALTLFLIHVGEKGQPQTEHFDYSFIFLLPTQLIIKKIYREITVPLLHIISYATLTRCFFSDLLATRFAIMFGRFAIVQTKG